jgi:hypothetical protein
MNVPVISPAVSAGTAGDTGWSATIDACHDFLGIAFGEYSDMDTFERACRDADRKAASQPGDPRILRARRLLADDIPLERAYDAILRDRSAPESPIDALVFSLRRGLGELTQPDTQRRLSAVAEDRLEAVCLSVQTFQPNIAEPWSADDADLLIAAWGKFHER